MIWYWSEILLSTSLGFFFFSPNISFGNVKFMFEIRWKNSGKKKKNSKCMLAEWIDIYIYLKAKIWYWLKFVFRPKFAGMAGTLRNSPKFDLRWNGRYYGTGLYAGTKYFGYSDQNGMESIKIISLTSPT